MSTKTMHSPDANTTAALPVAVIGAGPVGLAAAAHLVQRGMAVQVFEAGDDVAPHLQGYGHVRLFSPWRFNIDPAARALLDAQGWSAPDDEVLPSAGEVVQHYLAPLARTAALAPHIRFGARVDAVTRVGFDKSKTAGRDSAPFLLRVSTAGGIDEHLARAVIDATGTWAQPNPIGIHGLPALGESENAGHIAYGMPDILGAARSRYAGRTVLVVGAGHSAAGNLLALATLAGQAPGTRIVWAVRGTDLRRLFGGGANDGLPARGQIGTRLRTLVEAGQLDVRLGFGIRAIVRTPQGQLRIAAEDRSLPAIDDIDEIVAATGARPDLRIASELRLRLDPWLESTDALAPLIDPNVHSCGTVRPHGHRELSHPEPGFYAIGAKSYGRAPNFLMATGYEQARSVVAALAGDRAAADDVQLELPETGVCSVDFARQDAAAAATANGCCGGPAKVDASACCVLDETKKAEGQSGCGCTTAAPPVKARAPVATAAPQACCG
ncbi:NAD(P)-binding domain-containing protein [Comamonadaceae bacterium G21597-S1]|nr:NAD(P)-binding domain-containing protein [Comamonadaceae bacterium G21597-S1]